MVWQITRGLIPLIFLAMALWIPALRAFWEGFLQQGWQGLWHIWQDPYYLGKLRWSVQLAAGSTLLAVCLGVPTAWLLARYHFWGKHFLLRLLLLPFVVPATVAVLGLLALFGNKGWSGLDLQGTAILMVLGNLFYNQALIVRLCYTGFKSLNPHWLESAQSLGLASWRIWLQLILPLMWPSLVSGASLCFLYIFSAFSLPLMLGGQKYSTLEVEIYSALAFQLKLGDAAALALLQLCCTALATGLYIYFQPKRTTALLHTSSQTPKGYTWFWIVFWMLLTLVIGLSPLLAVVIKSFVTSDGWGLRYYISLFANNLADLRLALWNTLYFGVVSMVLSLVLGIMYAWTTWRTAWFALDLLSLLPLMISAMSVGVGYIVLYPQFLGYTAVLIMAYTVFALPLVIRTLLPALQAFPMHTLDAGRSLGAGPWSLFVHIIFPQLLPAVRTASALALASAFGEFAATLLLSRPEWLTLNMLIYERLGRPGSQNLGEAMALASLLLALTVLCFSALEHKE